MGMVMSKYDTLAKAMTERLAQLSSRTERIEDELRAPLDPDSSEQANQLEDDDPLEGIDAVLTNEMQAIRAALSRIEDGSYGTCIECGEEIAMKRLVAMPTAIRCISCASDQN